MISLFSREILIASKLGPYLLGSGVGKGVIIGVAVGVGIGFGIGVCVGIDI